MELIQIIYIVDGYVRRFTRYVAIISFVATLFMMFLITTDVVGRTFFNRAVWGCYELVELAMAAAILSSLAYCQAQREHVHVTLLIQKFRPRIRLTSYAVMSLFSTIVIAIVTYATSIQAMTSYNVNQVTSVLHFPYWISYAFMSLMMLLFAVTLLYDCVKNFIAIFNTDLAKEIQSNWS
jgi:TRAP-type C4-dicarboxylate transport system permease small subunit